MPKQSQTLDRSVVFAAALIVAVGGLIYELILGTASSYLFGDSIVSFSVSTGLTLFGMGIGSLLAAKLAIKPGLNFVRNELILSFIGGNSVLILFAAFSLTKIYWLVFVLLTLAIGIAIGAEIPLLISMVKQKSSKKSVDLLSKVMAADYFGALVASLLFPFILLPYLGLVKSAYAVAILNSVVAWFMLRRLGVVRRLAAGTYALAVVTSVVLVGGFVFSAKVESAINVSLYQDPVVHYQFTPYQKVVLTNYKNDTRLYLSDQLQFSSIDEARYHETLAHAALTSVNTPKNVLILGGGDGLLAREVLKYSSVQNITVVDIDPAVTEMARQNRLISKLNNGSMKDRRVQVVNKDAFGYVRDGQSKYDAILADLVDPSNERIAKLYSKEFYVYVQNSLTEKGVFITQATSPYFTPKAFWQIGKTAQAAMPSKILTPVSVNVPSFGEWGFVLMVPNKEAVMSAGDLPSTVKYHSLQTLQATRTIPRDVLSVDQTKLKVSTLIEPKTYQTYQSDMSQWRY